MENKSSVTSEGKNAYTFECEAVNKFALYGLCKGVVELHRIGLLRGYADCAAQIEKGACPALKMIAEELEAGEAIYFEPWQGYEHQTRKLAASALPSLQGEAVRDAIRRFMDKIADGASKLVMPKRATGGIAPSGPAPKKAEKPAKIEDDPLAAASEQSYGELVNRMAAQERDNREENDWDGEMPPEVPARPMTGLFGQLTPEQQAKVLGRGEKPAEKPQETPEASAPVKTRKTTVERPSAAPGAPAGTKPKGSSLLELARKLKQQKGAKA